MLKLNLILFFIRKRRCKLLPVFLCVATFLSAQSNVAPTLRNSASAFTDEHSREVVDVVKTGEDYLIAVDDVLDVYIVDVGEMSRAFRVSPSGTVSLPLLEKPLPAAGLTLPQFSESIREALRKSGVVMNAQVTVSVQQSRLHSISVTGAVKRPQSYAAFGHTTLLDAISQAEGLSDDAGNIAIVRRGDIAVRALNLDPRDDAALTTRVDIKQITEGRDASINVVIYPGDHITVLKAGIVYVVGAVNKPGGYPIRSGRQGMTVMQAVALAEDVKSTARRDRAMVVRVDSSSRDGRTQIPVDLKKVVTGKAPDPVLQAEDILFIPDSTGKKAMHRSLDTAVQLATGVALLGRY